MIGHHWHHLSPKRGTDGTLKLDESLKMIEVSDWMFFNYFMGNNGKVIHTGN